MATPNLNHEIVVLRRKLGDIYDSSGNLIVESTSPGAGEITVGNAALLSTWTSAEILDIYNDAIRVFIDHCLRFLPEERLGEMFPGYLVLSPHATVANTTINSIVYYYVDIDALTPPLYKVISIKNDVVTTELSLGAYIRPSEFFSSAYLETRKQLLFTQIFLAGSVNKNVLVFKNMAGSQGVDLLYVKQHTNLVYAHATIDLAGFSGIALRRIVLIAEALAQRYRSQEVRDLPDAEVQSLMQMDSIGLDKRGK